MDKAVFLYWRHTPSTEYWQHCSCWFHQYYFKSHCSNAYSVLLYQCDVIETSMRNSTKVCRRSFRRAYSVMCPQRVSSRSSRMANRCWENWASARPSESLPSCTTASAQPQSGHWPTVKSGWSTEMCSSRYDAIFDIHNFKHIKTQTQASSLFCQ